MSNLIIAVGVFFLVIGGPLTLFVLIKVLSRGLGGLSARFVRCMDDEAKLGIFVSWDKDSYPLEVFRVRVDFHELVRGGRSTSFSFTFPDSGSKKKSFVLPMKLSKEQLEMLIDKPAEPRAMKNSYAYIEVEASNNETQRVKIKKSKILEALRSSPLNPSKNIEVLDATEPDKWSFLTRVYPWRKTVLEVATKEKASAGGPAATSSAPVDVDFNVTKVWIEPGCIVCDACENEAPEVFWVKEDTCIVRDNAPLDNAAAIAAAAEGCPVDVIKFTTEPKKSA